MTEGRNRIRNYQCLRTRSLVLITVEAKTGDMMQDIKAFLRQCKNTETDTIDKTTHYSGCCCGMNGGAHYAGLQAERGPRSYRPQSPL